MIGGSSRRYHQASAPSSMVAMRQRQTRAPRSKREDQPGNDDAAEGRAERRAAVHQHGAAGTLFRRQPDRIELGARREKRRLGRTETDAADQQEMPPVASPATA